MKRFWTSVFMLICLMLVVPCMVSAAASSPSDAIHLVIEGKQVEADVPPMISDGRTMVPVRVVAEKMGAEVQWDQDTQTATVIQGQKSIKMQLDNIQASINDKSVKLDTPPQIMNHRMLLPLRFVGEALGSTIGWDPTSRTVIANQSVQVHINGEDVSNSVKSYKLDDTLYMPVQPILQKVGVNASDLPLDLMKTIDSVKVAPISVLDSLLNGHISWDSDRNQVMVEHLQYFEGYTVTDPNHVILKTSIPVTPQSFMLDNPRRLVIDLPNTKLADQIDEHNLTLPAAESSPESNPADSSNQTDSSAAGPTADSQQTAAAMPSPLIQNVRYGQYSESPYTVRVVLELSQNAKYTITTNQNEISISLNTAPQKTGYLIVVDAGHGGKDPGAKGVSGNDEKDYNLSVAKKLVEDLKKYPEFQVVATRSTDTFVELKDRAKIANDMGADLFISIHANSFKPDSRGTETYYYNGVSKEFANIVHRHLVGATKFPDRGVQTAPFVVIKQTTMPAVLTETGFLTNQIENSQLTSPDFQAQIAQALADAIREYYQSHH
ncbi:N-acetylmuramoyl-L-alanine amidase [Brevibacillus ginsengisoli]|uniref:N-acetylmuramoyl-L-alanine amidase n=1 Tax=Brevibacillus ginsengisoli TaxID=363854 RepID=UPI003CF6FEB1